MPEKSQQMDQRIKYSQLRGENWKRERKASCLHKREKWTVHVGKVFEDGWITKQIAMLLEGVDV